MTLMRPWDTGDLVSRWQFSVPTTRFFLRCGSALGDSSTSGLSLADAPMGIRPYLFFYFLRPPDLAARVDLQTSSTKGAR